MFVEQSWCGFGVEFGLKLKLGVCFEKMLIGVLLRVPGSSAAESLGGGRGFGIAELGLPTGGKGWRVMGSEALLRTEALKLYLAYHHSMQLSQSQTRSPVIADVKRNPSL